MNRDDFEKAKKIADQWPSWKRDYQLTKSQVSHFLAAAESNNCTQQAKKKKN